MIQIHLASIENKDTYDETVWRGSLLENYHFWLLVWKIPEIMAEKLKADCFRNMTAHKHSQLLHSFCEQR